MSNTWGWAGSASNLLSTPHEEWIAQLTAHHAGLLGASPSASQVAAWRDEHRVMARSLAACVAAKQTASDWAVIFEYELPFEGGRRPDVVLLAGSSVIVLEFKSEAVASQASIDQAAAYARDLAEYHSESHDRVEGHLVVLPRATTIVKLQGEPISSSDELPGLLVAMSSDGQISLETWLEGSYSPLPSLVDAARRIFKEEDLPHVRRALSAGIPETLDAVSSVVDQARNEGARHIVFLTGVPGAGKTLVGLRLVYERSGDGADATFLSGNGPLVQVLQDALKSSIFVRDLHKFVQSYGVQQKVPSQHVVVFDEAQRAWDAKYMDYKGKSAASEPDLTCKLERESPSGRRWSASSGRGRRFIAARRVACLCGMPRSNRRIRVRRGSFTVRLTWPPPFRGRTSGSTPTSTSISRCGRAPRSTCTNGWQLSWPATLRLLV